MDDCLRLTCTILADDYDEENLFLRSYFPVLVNERQGQSRKYYSLATRSSYTTIIEVIEKQLQELGITNYSFNIATDFKLKSLSK